jgi:hypothetical protein
MQNFGWPISLASSSDGTKLVAGKGVNNFPLGGQIYSSTDSGATWVATGSPSSAWSSVASSADGIRLVAGIGGVSAATITGPIYVSADSGRTWIASDSPTNYWASVASSADGYKLVAAVNGGGIYIGQSTPMPTLSFTASGEALILSWTVPSMDFVLEQTSDLSTGTWAESSVTPTLNYATLQLEVTLPKTKGPTFYRLASR